MPRRSYSYATRKAARRTSKLPKGALPPGRDSFTGADLVAIAGCQPKTISQWRRMGLLPRVVAKGVTTSYDRNVARRVLAIAKAGVQAARLPRFAEMIPLILDEVPRRDAAAVPAAMAPTIDSLAADVLARGLAPAPLDTDAPLPGRVWHYVELLPGLEIRLAADAPPALRVLVRDVARRFGVVL